MQITAEQLAYWYLRLNGFLNIPNFVVHPEQGGNQRTDVDVLGVRFPYRAELFSELPRSPPMQDDEPFRRLPEKTFIILAEVKAGMCSLNGPWTDPNRQNMQRVLRAVGAFPEPEVEPVAFSLYARGCYFSQLYLVSLLCMGDRENPRVSENFPDVPQITWATALHFIHRRFRRYRRQKASHGTWDRPGRELWDCAMENRTPEEFIDAVEIVA